MQLARRSLIDIPVTVMQLARRSLIDIPVTVMQLARRSLIDIPVTVMCAFNIRDNPCTMICLHHVRCMCQLPALKGSIDTHIHLTTSQLSVTKHDVDKKKGLQDAP